MISKGADGAGLGASPALAIAVKWDAAILGVDCTIMSEKKIATDKSASALHTFERSLLCVCKIC
ncbi:hypothetical protein QX201_008546 [Fusarium graminearum]